MILFFGNFITSALMIYVKEGNFYLYALWRP